MREISEIKELLEKIPYLNISSVTPEGMPWLSPVWAVYDEEYNFYWTSSPDSQHSKNIENKNDLYMVVFDSTVPAGNWGLYMTGQAKELSAGSELQKAIELFYKRKGTEPKTQEYFLDQEPRRMYKVTPIKFWVNDYDKTRIPADIKTEVKLK